MNAGLIGYGNMGSALLKGITACFPDWKLGVMEADKKKALSAESECRARIVATYKELNEFSDIILLVIKPQQLHKVAKEAEGAFRNSRIISVLAGTSISSVKSAFEAGMVVRFMPNIAAAVNKSVTAVAYGPGTDDLFRKTALSIAESTGAALELDEKLFSAFTALSGSGIAFVYHILHAMALGGTKQGIPYPVSLEIACETMNGAVSLASASQENPATLLTRVLSPGGTTIAGVSVLEEKGCSSAIIQAIEAASERATELETQ